MKGGGGGDSVYLVARLVLETSKDKTLFDHNLFLSHFLKRDNRPCRNSEFDI